MKNTQTHRLIPGYLGGKYTPENTVELTIKQHARAHWVEWMLTGREGDRIAWRALSGQITMSEASKEAQSMGGRASGKTWTLSDETKKKQSEAKMGEKNGMKGKKHSAETRKKISELMTGKKRGKYNKNKGMI